MNAKEIRALKRPFSLTNQSYRTSNESEPTVAAAAATLNGKNEKKRKYFNGEREKESVKGKRAFM